MSGEIRVVKGSPTDAELAAVIAVLTSLSRCPAGGVAAESNLWGHPVDKLRYGFGSWEAVTLRDRTHIRR